jgi:hypothetical protein
MCKQVSVSLPLRGSAPMSSRLLWTYKTTSAIDRIPRACDPQSQANRSAGRRQRLMAAIWPTSGATASVSAPSPSTSSTRNVNFKNSSATGGKGNWKVETLGELLPGNFPTSMLHARLVQSKPSPPTAASKRLAKCVSRTKRLCALYLKRPSSLSFSRHRRGITRMITLIQ